MISRTKMHHSNDDVDVNQDNNHESDHRPNPHQQQHLLPNNNNNDDDDDDDSDAADIHHHNDQRHMNDSTMPPPLSTRKQLLPPPPQRATTTTTIAKTSRTKRITSITPMKSPAEIAMGGLSSSSSSIQARNKQQQRQGFGLADWTRLLSVSKDLAQLKGQSIRSNITMNELKQHNTIHDGWIVLQNKVYNITPYLYYHPGGSKILQTVLGKDATTLFNKYHRWVNIDGLIGKLLIGYIDRSSSSSATVKSNTNDSDDDDDDDDE